MQKKRTQALLDMAQYRLNCFNTVVEKKAFLPVGKSVPTSGKKVGIELGLESWIAVLTVIVNYRSLLSLLPLT
jgi:hypothetical protein